MKRIASLSAVLAALAFAGTAHAAKASQKDVCDNLTQFDEAVSNLARIGPESTVGTLREAQNNVNSSWNKFVSSAESYAKPQTDNLKNMIKQLANSAQKIPDNATIAQAQSALRNDVAQVRLAADQLGIRLSCGSMALGGTGSSNQQQNQDQNQ